MIISCKNFENPRNRAIISVDLDHEFPLKITIIRPSDYTVILDTFINDQKFSLVLDSMSPSAYSLEMHWEVQNLSREEMRQMIKEETTDEPPQNVLQKILYINPSQDSIYSLKINNKIDREHFELSIRNKDPRYSLVLQTKSQDAQLLECFEEIDRNFGVEYLNKKDSISAIAFTNDEISSTSSKENEIASLWEQNKYFERSLELKQQLMMKNLKSPVVPYVLYSYGYSLKGMKIFEPVIASFDKSIINSAYGKLLFELLK